MTDAGSVAGRAGCSLLRSRRLVNHSRLFVPLLSPSKLCIEHCVNCYHLSRYTLVWAYNILAAVHLWWVCRALSSSACPARGARAVRCTLYMSLIVLPRYPVHDRYLDRGLKTEATQAVEDLNGFPHTRVSSC